MRISLIIQPFAAAVEQHIPEILLFLVPKTHTDVIPDSLCPAAIDRYPVDFSYAPVFRQISRQQIPYIPKAVIKPFAHIFIEILTLINIRRCVPELRLNKDMTEQLN